ncbi:MAG: hypothetical protein LBI59_05225 [Candidatus Accumulibacter sp.]|jgi:hypothetical protein|nr:hypothetical protein [Accumulibacter sp.]
MSATLTLLDHIGESYRRMVTQADALDWDGLAEEWQRIHPKIVQLQRMTLFDHLGGQERTQAARQVAELLGFEERIKARITPWMEQVRPLLEVFRKYPIRGQKTEN